MKLSETGEEAPSREARKTLASPCGCAVQAADVDTISALPGRVRGCRLGSGSCCWELDEDTPRARRSPEQAVAVAAKSCDEGDFHECDWLGFALGRREPIMKDDARYRAADRGVDRFAMESCRAGDIEICLRGIKIVSSGKKALEAQLETTAAARCDAGEVGACVAFGDAILFTQTERARGVLEESCNGGALGSCWSYASALRITGKAAPLGVEIQRLVARACEHTAVGCGELEAIAEGSLE